MSSPSVREEQDDIERQRSLRRDAQRRRRNAETSGDREGRRTKNTNARRLSRSLLSPEQSADSDTAWWDRIALLNASEIAKPLGLRWNRNCKTCGIQALTGERIHDECFVCGPKGIHYRPPLPPYPHEWDGFIDDRKTAALSRKLNNIFSLTAIGVYDGDFMKYPDGIAAVTLAGGRTYHRMLPSHEGQHAIRWFIHDPASIFTKGTEMQIPPAWINSTLAGLELVNPFVAELEKLNVYNDSDDIALHIEHSDGVGNEIAAVISLAPASPPSRRKLVIRRKGDDEPIFLDLLSPFTEPLHYLLLLPHGIMGWSPGRLTSDGEKF